MFFKMREKLGDEKCTYMERWVLDFDLFSIRLHHFLVSDDRVLHDHPWWFLSLLIKGTYREYTPEGISNWRKPGSLIFRKPLHRHSVELAAHTTCWTLCITGSRKREWGFWRLGRFWPHQKYFGTFGHPPCKD